MIEIYGLCVCVICICMNLWGIAVFELDSHPEHCKGPDHAPCACPKTHPIDILHSRQPTF